MAAPKCSSSVVLGAEEDLFRSQCTVADLNLLEPSLLRGSREAEVKVRYATPSTTASLHPAPNGTVMVRFHRPQRALSPGQSAVFYQGDRVLGGGVIQPS